MLPLRQSHHQRFICLLLLISAFLFDEISCFSVTNSKARHSSNPSPLDRFHKDMHRVLELRYDGLSEALESSRQRHRVILQSDVDGAERVHSMLQHIIQLNLATEESFQICLRALVRRQRIQWRQEGVLVNAADQAELLLSKLEDLLVPSGVSLETYNLVLETFAACASPRSIVSYADKAESLLNRIEYNATSLMHVLHAHAWEQPNRKGVDSHACRAQELLEQIHGTCHDPFILLKSCDFTLEAWSRSATPQSAERADQILQKMKALNSTLSSNDDAGRILSSETFSNAILAWSKSEHSKAAGNSQKLLLELTSLYLNGSLADPPPLIAFNAVISAFGRLGRPKEAESILKHMDNVGLCMPDTFSYNSILYGYLTSKTYSMQRIKQLVEQMQDRGIKANAFTYSTLLKCWIKSGEPDSVEQAERLLAKLEKLWSEADESLPLPQKGTNVIFNMVINAYAKSRDRMAATKALELLDRMKLSDSYTRPDIVTYTSVLECLSKSNDAEAPAKAQVLFQEAFDLYHETGDSSLRPNLRTFTMAILTLAKHQGSIVQARDLLTQLVDLYEATGDPQLKPNAYPYNYVLNCAANSLENQAEAFRLATLTYKDMREAMIEPDSYTYAFWLKCCKNLLPVGDIRNKCVSFAFQECKERGLVTNEVLTRLVQGCSPSLVAQLLELKGRSSQGITAQDVSAAWSRNTRRKRW